MMPNRHIAATGWLRTVPLLVPLLVLAAGMPARAQVRVMGMGLYDFLIQTNCFAMSEQLNTRTPIWITDGTYPDNRVPLLATGTTDGIVRTVDLADQVSFLSSNPAVIPPPAKIQAVGAIGGVHYQPTNVHFTIKQPSKPTDVDITAVGTVNSVIGTVVQLGQPKRVVRKFRVYPAQKISKATVAPAKPAPFTVGERVRIDVTLPWKIPIATTTVEFGQPVYKNRQGSTRTASGPEWKYVSGFYGPQRVLVRPNTNTVSFEFAATFPSDAAVERLGPVAVQTAMVVPVRLKSENPGICPGLVTNPTSVDVSFKVQKQMSKLPAQPASSTAPSQIQQAPTLQQSGDSTQDGVLAPRDPLPTKPDPEPETYPKPSPRR